MKKINVLASRVLGIALAVMAIVLFGACTDEEKAVTRSVVAKAAPAPNPSDPNRYFVPDWRMECVASERDFAHTGTSTLYIFQTGAEEPETSFVKTLKSSCSINAGQDTVRVDEGSTAVQTAVSIDRGFKGNSENDNVIITVSDGQVIELPYTAEHAKESWMDVDYHHVHDSILSAKLLKVEDVEPMTRGNRAPAKYVKKTVNRRYHVGVTTQAFDANGNKMGAADEDTLVVTAIAKVFAENNVTNTKTGDGVKVINGTQQRDSVIITKTWDDGHSENMVFNTILERSLKNIEKREVIAPNFDGATYATSFSRVEGGERLVRQDAYWKIYGREVVITKMVSVGGMAKELVYTFYQERAELAYENISHKFDYVDWQVSNYADDFKNAVSAKAGYDELDYTNEIRTSYLGYIQFAEESIAWFKESVKVLGYDVINAQRIDYATYTFVTLDKIAYYSDGSEPKVVGKYSAKLPIVVTPLTNWVINDEVFGVYTSGNLEGNLVGKTAETDKFFSYQQYTYRYSNVTNGQVNALRVIYPNDIVFSDGDVTFRFANSELKVEKKNELTSFVGEDSEKTTYSYACIAGVTFGASQEVTLPGTINIKKSAPEPEPNHEHGKVVATYMTSTPNENRSYWYNCAVIQFEDGYRMVGLADNNAMEFGFNMNSYKDVNSAVYSNGQWIPAKAEDNPGLGAMIWYDENGSRRRNLDYITATAIGWNNGHNTVVDPRREGRISADGYSVTFYLNGLAGQTLNF